MTPESAIRVLIDEIRADRAERRQQFDRIELRLTVLEREVKQSGQAVAALSLDLRDFRDKVFRDQDEHGRRLRMVANFAGMTDPHEGNGG